MTRLRKALVQEVDELWNLEMKDLKERQNDDIEINKRRGISMTQQDFDNAGLRPILMLRDLDAVMHNESRHI